MTGSVGSGARLAGAAAVVFSVVYLLSDVIEALHGGFSSAQLWLTLIAETAVPFFVIGLWFAQRLSMGRIGRLSAVAYAYAYIFFTGTVVYALVNHTSDFAALDHALRPWMTIHGAIMLFAGLGFGWATLRARVLPGWTGVALMLGVVCVALALGSSEVVQVVAAAVRDLGFAGMGAALLTATAATKHAVTRTVPS